MKRTPLFAAAAILTVAAFLSTKANVKKSSVITAYCFPGGANATLTGLNPSHFTNVKGSLKTIILATVGGTKLATFFTNPVLSVNKVYYKP